MFSDSTRRELRTERERLRRRLDAIDQILAEEAGIEVVSAPEAATIGPANGNGHPGLTDLGLRGAARRVLEAAPRGMKPKAVAERMEELGFESITGATTPLITRVRNELWRMANRGELRRSGGTYSVRRDAT